MSPIASNTLHVVAENLAVDMAARQQPLQTHYQTTPADAWITDSATTHSRSHSPAMPLHGHVTLQGGRPLELRYGVHTAVGGESDEPVPGELLCAAIAACFDSTVRILANRFGIALDTLEVQVDAMVDVRGTLLVDRSVPVGFQKIALCARISSREPPAPGVIERLMKAAEHSCVVLQTMRNGPAISVRCEVR